ncbi:MAG: beta-ketoacyl synthase N-terminal-like domain-containing protein [Desulfosudaceae bacterium]
MTDTDKYNTAAAEDIAIIGMSCVFPGASGLDQYWQNILAGVDCISDAPPEAWDQGVLFDPESNANDRVYCKRGGFLGEQERAFNPLQYGVMPSGVEGAEPDQFLGLRVAHEALADAGYLDDPASKDRTAVILGRGAYVNAGQMNLVQHGWIVEQTLHILERLHPEYTEKQLQEIKKELVSGLPPLTAEIVPGQVPNIAAGRIANRLDLKGPSFTVDAACASSLIALDLGLKSLRSRECDLAIVGGMQGGNTVLSYLMFCLIKALSKSSQIRPFDQNADGTILGEGVGMIVLKRLPQARKDNDRVYAVIKGMGTASDGRALGILAPRLEGAALAVERAYEATGLSPATIGLMEAHGTATIAGDITEFNALQTVFGGRKGKLPSCAIGSVKSMIGHSLGAAGIAGMIKAALALYHKVLPPTLNCTEPNAKLGLERSNFYINTETRPWIHGLAAAPRRAGVNCMGFGGINAHAVLEEFTENQDTERPGCQTRWDSEVFIFQGASRQELIDQARRVLTFIAGAPEVEPRDLAYTLNSTLQKNTCRLAIVAAAIPELEKKLSNAVKRLADPECRRIMSRGGVYFFAAPVKNNGKLAFLFPGEGSQYINMLSDLCIHFPEVRNRFDRMDGIFSGHARDFFPSDFIFPRPVFSQTAKKEAEEDLFKMDVAVEAVLTANDALLEILHRLDIHPDAVLGHSTGEYSSMRAAGILNITDSEQYLLELNKSYEETAAKGGIPRAVLVAVAADSEKVASIIAAAGGELHIAMDNCPLQTVIAGAPEDMTGAVKELQRQNIICQTLSFDRPYHTPLFKKFAEDLSRFYDQWPVAPPAIPIYSCTTADRFPADAAAIRKIAVAHWLKPVQFRQTIEKMYADNVRIFVEVGPRGNLTSFVKDILGRRDHAAIALNTTLRSGITQLNHVVAMLVAHGVDARLDYLYHRRKPCRLVLAGAETGRGKTGQSAGAMTLSTQFPRMQLRQVLPSMQPPETAAAGEDHPSPEIQRPASPAEKISPPANRPPTDAGSLVMQEYMKTVEKIIAVEQTLMHQYLAAGSAEPVPVSPAPGHAEAADGLWTAALAQAGRLAAGQETAHDADRPGPPLPAAAARPADDPQPISSGESAFEDIKSQLLDLVRASTGYPVEMLDLSLGLEADLGIDSIKRLEILGKLWDNQPELDPDDLEEIATLKTLEEMIQRISECVNAGQVPPAKTAPGAPDGADEKTGEKEPPPADHPFIDRILSFTPDREVEVLSNIDLEEALFLHHHTIGRKISVTREDLTALPVMPLTMSMEILAETASLLMPGKVLIGMDDIRAYRWIAIEHDFLSLKIKAVRNPGTDAVKAEIRRNDETGAVSKNPLVEGVLVFADHYPPAPDVQPITLHGERASRWKPADLYARGMFHGPCWRGVRSVDRWGENGTVATFSVLPTDDFFKTNKSPPFVTDPVTLDAAGQLVGFWTMEHLEDNFLVFPYRAKRLRIHGPRPPVNQAVKGQAGIKLLDFNRISSDIDITNADGELWMRLEEWEDKRFDLPPAVLEFLLSPVTVRPSETWTAPVEAWPDSSQYHCRRLARLFTGDDDFWKLVFSHLILNHTERQVFANLGESNQRQVQWLMGRLAAKDAVRTILKQRYDMEAGPADVEITPDEYGCPVPTGTWEDKVEEPVRLSLSHTTGMAAAIAGQPGNGLGIGIAVECLDRRREGMESIALGPEEKTVLQSALTSADPEWLLRVWCAKEAVSKACGRGLPGGPRDLVVKELEPETGAIRLEISGTFARTFPSLQGAAAQVHTLRQDNIIVASAMVNKGD